MDITSLPSFAAMHYREDAEQIDAMERNTRFPVEEIIKRRNALRIKAEIVKVIRIVAETAAIRELVEQQMGAGV